MVTRSRRHHHPLPSILTAHTDTIAAQRLHMPSPLLNSSPGSRRHIKDSMRTLEIVPTSPTQPLQVTVGSEEEQPPTPPLLPGGKVIDGEAWPPVFTAENVRSAKAMKPRADDVFICTYPKCGTTWIQHIVHQCLGKTEYEAAMDDDDGPSPSTRGDDHKAMCFVSPMIERMGAAYADTIRTPRVLKSHFTYKNIPKGGGAKYIYAVRNPKDCLTSYFHHNRNFKIYNFEHGTFGVFFELFMAGRLGFGDYFAHLNSWMEGLEKNDERILFLTYEDMLVDLKSAVIKIANFLGGKAAELIKDDARLEEIVANSTLSAMKKNQQRWFPNKQLHRTEFIRKGGSRDWKNYFSAEQSAWMDQRFAELTRGTAAENWWTDEMQWEDDVNSLSSNGNSCLSSPVNSSAMKNGTSDLVDRFVTTVNIS